MKMKSMKRLVAWLMCLCLVMGCAAFAEESSTCEHTNKTLQANIEYHWYKCEDCGELLDAEFHTMTENSVCTLCGEIVCNHKYGEEYVFEGDASQHTIYCAACGQVIGYKEHTRVFCMVCGWNGCNHDGERIPFDLDDSPDFHRVICSICGRGEFPNEAHQFDENGVCTLCYWCGHTHKTLHTDPEYHWFECGDCGNQIESERHTVENFVCTVCGENVCEHNHVTYLPMDSDLQHAVFCYDCGFEIAYEDHTFEDWCCSVCGQMYCEHDGEIDYSDFDDPAVHKLYCMQCQMYLRTEPHDPDENNGCVKCGYWEHEHVEKVLMYDDFHLVVCTICGNALGEGSSEHTPDADGVCTVCGWYAHEHVPEVRSFDTPDFHSFFCAICDQYLSAEQHAADENGVCTVCGYQFEEPENPEEPEPQPEKPVTEPKKEPEAEKEYEIIDSERSVEMIGIDGEDGTVEIVNIALVLNAEEVEALSKLSVKEQVLTVLLVLNADEESGIELSGEATALKEAVLSRIAAMTAEEQNAFRQSVAGAFATRTVTVNGEKAEVIVVELKVVRDGVETISSFGLLHTADGVKLIRF